MASLSRGDFFLAGSNGNNGKVTAANPHTFSGMLDEVAKAVIEGIQVDFTEVDCSAGLDDPGEKSIATDNGILNQGRIFLSGELPNLFARWGW